LPAWFGWLSVGFMFYAELVAPFFVFGPRPIRLVGFTSLLLLQFLIAATGNYGFFNLLAVVICLCILDDRDWEWLRSCIQRGQKSAETPGAVDRAASGEGQPWRWPRRLLVGAVGGMIIAVTGSQTVEIVAPEFPVPSEIVILSEWLEPFRSTNHYGLFAVMTTTRPEIIVEGSDDELSWRPFRFRWKPCELDRPPRFMAPHMPRLDWQMWFAALAGNCRLTPWFVRFEQKLLEGSPAVLALLRDNPFPDRPPRYVRARLYLYTFTETGSDNWWSRVERGLFCPSLSLGDFR
jgi:hypothetical protein